MRKHAVNLWAVLVCVVICQIIPALWYGYFSDIWLSLNNLTMEQAKAGESPVPYLASIVSASFSMYTMAWIFTKIPVKTLLAGFLIGGLFGLVFVGFEGAVKDLFTFKPVLLSIINGSVSVITYAISGAILGLWKKFE